MAASFCRKFALRKVLPVNSIASQFNNDMSGQPVLDKQRLVRLREIIELRTGLHFSDNKLKELEAAYSAAQRDMPQIAPNAFWEQIAYPGKTTNQCFDRLISYLTIKETHFFRNSFDFNVLREQILPDLITRRRGTSRSLRLWSAGCATGEEAYSLAIVIADLISDLESWEILILGTDIDIGALEKAERGIYSNWSFRGVSDEIRSRCFIKKDNDLFELHADIRRMVTFRQLNIVEDKFPCANSKTVDMDLILCRNVLIYFQPQTIVEVSNRFYDALAEDGLLIVGHAEHGANLHPRFRQENIADTLAYRKDGNGKVILPNLAIFNTTNRPPENGTAPINSRSPSCCTSKPKVTTLMPDSTVVANAANYLVIAKIAYQSGDYVQSIRTLKEYLISHPDSHEAILLLARNYANLGNQDAAKRCCEQAVRLKPMDVESHYFSAILAINEGRLNDAVVSLRKAIYLDSTSWASYYELGNCLKALNITELSLKAFRTAEVLLADKPDSTEVPYCEGVLVSQLKRSIARELEGKKREEGQV